MRCNRSVNSVPEVLSELKASVRHFLSDSRLACYVEIVLCDGGGFVGAAGIVREEDYDIVVIRSATINMRDIDDAL